MSRRVLFVGGVCDGEVWEFASPRRFFRVPLAVPVALFPEVVGPESFCVPETHDYVLTPVEVFGFVVPVYVLSSLRERGDLSLPSALAAHLLSSTGKSLV